jgi:glucokinase
MAASQISATAVSCPGCSIVMTGSMRQPPYVVGVDLGGTETKAALVDAVGDIVVERRRDAAAGGVDGVAHVEAIAALVDELRSCSVEQPSALALVVPGIVDEENGLGIYSKNLGWKDVPFRDLVASRCELPTAFGHDVRAGALAEYRLGAAQGFRDVVFMPIGTGIAAALVSDGRVYSAGGYAGEIGHVDTGHGEECSCGLRGCFEAIASASAIARRYSARSGRPTDTAEEVSRLVPQGDPDARAVWDEAVDAACFALAWTAGVLAPEAVVIGGGLSLAGELLFDPLRRGLESRLSFQRVPLVLPAALGDRAGCLGAALLAQELVQS